MSKWPSFGGTAQTPVLTDLYSVDENSSKWSPNMAEKFHHIVTWLLFSSKWASPDTLVAVVYLCTRIKSPTVSDYYKLTQLIKYIRGIIHLPLLLGWNESRNLT